jgi:hypothetical protein
MVAQAVIKGANTVLSSLSMDGNSAYTSQLGSVVNGDRSYMLYCIALLTQLGKDILQPTLQLIPISRLLLGDPSVPEVDSQDSTDM